MPPEHRLLILGIGNLLMGDEGVGVHAIQSLETLELPPNVDLLDGGTGGFHLLSWLAQYRELILIDATMDGEPAGTIRITQPRFLSDYPRSLAAHDIGLRDLLEAAALTGPLPVTHLITVSIESLGPLSTELSEPVREGVPRVVDAVFEIIRRCPASAEKIAAGIEPA